MLSDQQRLIIREDISVRCVNAHPWQWHGASLFPTHNRVLNCNSSVRKRWGAYGDRTTFCAVIFWFRGRRHSKSFLSTFFDPICRFTNRRGSPWSSTGMHIRRITKRWSNFGRWPRINAALHFDAYRLASLQDSFVTARLLVCFHFESIGFPHSVHESSRLSSSGRFCCIFHRRVYRSCYGKVAIYFSRRSSRFGLQVRYLLTAMTNHRSFQESFFLRAFKFSNGNSFCAVRSYRRVQRCRISTISNDYEVGVSGASASEPRKHRKSIRSF